MRIRKCHGRRTVGIKIPITHRKIHGSPRLGKKIRKSDMSIEAITEAIHEYMYEKLYESPEIEEEKKIWHVEKRKLNLTRDQTDRNTKSRIMDCNRCGAPNWSKQHECPAREKMLKVW